VQGVSLSVPIDRNRLQNQRSDVAITR